MGDTLTEYCEEIASGELKLKHDKLDFERERFARAMDFEAKRLELEWYRAETDRLAVTRNGVSVTIPEGD